MESEFREDQKEKSREISRLSKEISALKTTLIGLDGQNGMRSQIANLSKDTTEIKNSLNSYLKTIYEMKAQESKYEIIFCTKAEHRASESLLCEKIMNINNKIEEDIEDREKARIEHEKYIENLGISKKALLISFLGLLSTSILGLFL